MIIEKMPGRVLMGNGSVVVTSLNFANIFYIIHKEYEVEIKFIGDDFVVKTVNKFNTKNNFKDRRQGYKMNASELAACNYLKKQI